jgi:DHA1 family inner membrane transport protein
VSLAFSVNAFAGIVGTRRSARRGHAWAWLAAIAGCAVVVGTVPLGIPFVVALAVWGFSFWMAVPAVFRLIEERALRPDERIGDAQAVMALGRVIGPALGGVVLGPGRFTPLALVAATGLAASAAMVGAVERNRLSAGTT